MRELKPPVQRVNRGQSDSQRGKRELVTTTTNSAVDTTHDLEKRIIGAALVNEDVAAILIRQGLRSEHFTITLFREAWMAIDSAIKSGETPDDILIGEKLESAGIKNAVEDLCALADPMRQTGAAELWGKELIQTARKRQTERTLSLALEAIRNNDTNATREALVKVTEGFDEDDRESGPTPFIFDTGKPPPHVEPIVTLAGKSVLTPGNFSTLGGGEKMGKTALFGGVLATAFNPDADGLGFKTSNPVGKAILAFDLEQSLSDFHKGMKRVLRRANIGEPPAWFYGYSLASFEPADAFATIRRLTDEAASQHGGVALIEIDGFADLVKGVNDEESSFETVRRIMEMARTYDCGILGVLHQNPSGEFSKMRGHLGSQCQRKGETYLVARSAGDGVFTVYTERARGAPVLEKDGPRYAWNDDAGMFTSVASKAQNKADQKTKDAWNIACQLAAGNPWKVWRHHELVKAFVDLRGASEATAKRWIRGQKAHDPSSALRFNAATGYYNLGVIPQKLIEGPANNDE